MSDTAVLFLAYAALAAGYASAIIGQPLAAGLLLGLAFIGFLSNIKRLADNED